MSIWVLVFSKYISSVLDFGKSMWFSFFAIGKIKWLLFFFFWIAPDGKGSFWCATNGLLQKPYIPTVCFGKEQTFKLAECSVITFHAFLIEWLTILKLSSVPYY